MRVRASFWISLSAILMITMAPPCLSIPEPVRLVSPAERSAPRLPGGGPLVILQAGDTTWIQVHADTTTCPGDPWRGHGGEATGGPDGSETWCFEGASPGSCGTNPPWDVKCFKHVDLKALPSPGGINFWHMDSYRADQQPYCGSCVLWCGSDGTWDGQPVECGTWADSAGYGNLWNCVAQLTLPDGFSVAGGCSVCFDVRYDTECKYDYLYLELYDGSAWQTLATFNATSDNPGPECGAQGEGNPDYWGNTDIDRLANCDWQTRESPGVPAFQYTAAPEQVGWMFYWVETDKNPHPSERIGHSMAYDSRRGRVVLFGGIVDDTFLNDTWEWDGSNWTEIFPADKPGPTAYGRMVYDELHHEIVLFGGYLETEPGVCADTWVWDGTNWTKLSPGLPPDPRCAQGMAYDGYRNCVVLFGGYDNGALFGDTWEWDGTSWTECYPDTSPPPRCFGGCDGLAYDQASQVAIVFGGGDGESACFGDTWVWNGTAWIEVFPACSPSARDGHTLAYSPNHGGVVLFGGNASGTLLNDTWIWSGSDWTELHALTEPPPRYRHSMVSGSGTGQLIIFGGLMSPDDLATDCMWTGKIARRVMLRWAFVSDTGWSDADGEGDTDGAAFIDNVAVVGDPGSIYVEDFEHQSLSTLLARGWSFPNHEGLLDGWHLTHDPDPPYEGDEAETRSTCEFDSSFVYRARPEVGYPWGETWRSGWYYRLMTPAIAVQNSGAVVQYDQYFHSPNQTCDYIDTKVRFFDGSYAAWCPWVNIDGYILQGDYPLLNIDLEEDLTRFYGPSVDSMQFAWDLMDLSKPWEFCRGVHTRVDHQVDNVSVGFFDGTATKFAVRASDLLHDTFFTGLCGYNSHFDVYDPDTVNHYWGQGDWSFPKTKQLYLDVTDKDGLQYVQLFGSADRGATWVFNEMTLDVPADPLDPSLGGTYYGTFCRMDFAPADTVWARGTEVWYYVRATDENASLEYFPNRADPSHPDHTNSHEDFFSFSILPMFPAIYEGPKVLLVNGYPGDCYDWSPCLWDTYHEVRLAELYERTFVDAGFCYDVFDIGAAGEQQSIQPTHYDDYDAVIWFTAPYVYSRHLLNGPSQSAIRDYLQDGGKVVLWGDRIAYTMARTEDGGLGGDSLNGEFLQGIMGCDYIDEMESAFDKPYVYPEAVDQIWVFDGPVAIQMDSLLVYRQCPGVPRDMSYIATAMNPPQGYEVQPLLEVANPGAVEADAAVYVETDGGGQCVFVNFDLGAVATHKSYHCLGETPDPIPPFNEGNYWGRVELLRLILTDIMGIPNEGSGQGGTSGVTPGTVYRWSLAQSTPNPCAGAAEIRYEVARACDVTLRVYSATGQLVRTLVEERKEPGRFMARWDGSNSAEARVASGVYFYRLEAAGFTATRKLALIR